MARGETAAIDQKRMPGDAAAGNVLIDHAAAHADEVILCALTDLGDFDRIERKAAFRQERMRARDFERSRGTQARSDRKLAPDEELAAGKVPPHAPRHNARP